MTTQRSRERWARLHVGLLIAVSGTVGIREVGPKARRRLMTDAGRDPGPARTHQRGVAVRTADEQRLDLVVLDDLLGELDHLDSDPSEAERVEEVRGRIEILMDEIDISLGIEPAPIAGYEETDPVTPDEEDAWSTP